ncbi:hypothetical protein LTR37_009729 [Vermiconidia calcicola]|uniref:Uncharacterized protein n=1 Tax=Vermiconidia calcicola TaxID=1690605 RepID=A0ACC3N733_9PEZI|nr:hypothetical protein LTR37_009729 [Vermiconidia calcicola]
MAEAGRVSLQTFQIAFATLAAPIMASGIGDCSKLHAARWPPEKAAMPTETLPSNSMGVAN